MMSKARLRLIRSLEQKKHRDDTGLYVVEGDKAVSDVLASRRAVAIFACRRWMEQHPGCADGADEVTECSDDELCRASFLRHPQGVIALFRQESALMSLDDMHTGLTLALDGVQDPGNVGTIVRIADWFGIEHVLCSRDTADIYNPKTVQATMGSIARVHAVHCDLVATLRSLSPHVAICGMLLDGSDIYAERLPANAVIVVGSEGRGLSEHVKGLVARRLRIPSFPRGASTAESLNAAVAAAIACSEFRRRIN